LLCHRIHVVNRGLGIGSYYSITDGVQGDECAFTLFEQRLFDAVALQLRTGACGKNREHGLGICIGGLIERSNIIQGEQA
jgi:hypothetical protein